MTPICSNCDRPVLKAREGEVCWLCHRTWERTASQWDRYGVDVGKVADEKLRDLADIASGTITGDAGHPLSRPGRPAPRPRADRQPAPDPRIGTGRPLTAALVALPRRDGVGRSPGAG